MSRMSEENKWEFSYDAIVAKTNEAILEKEKRQYKVIVDQIVVAAGKGKYGTIVENVDEDLVEDLFYILDKRFCVEYNNRREKLIISWCEN